MASVRPGSFGLSLEGKLAALLLLIGVGGAVAGMVLLRQIGSAWLAALLDAGSVALEKPAGLDPSVPLPAGLNPFALQFRFSPPLPGGGPGGQERRNRGGG